MCYDISSAELYVLLIMHKGSGQERGGERQSQR